MDAHNQALSSGEEPRRQSGVEQAGIWESVVEFVEATQTIVKLEIRKLSHDPTELVTRAVQPALWLLVFGSVFNRLHTVPTGGIPYLDYIAPGILAQSVLFMAIFYGITSIRERDTGIIVKFLVSPAPRAALVCGKALSAGVRALSQAVIVYILALILRIHLNWHPLALLGVVLLVLLGAAFFSMFSLIIATLVKTQERFMGVGQLMTMPLFFASNALYPVTLMPNWLRAVSYVNPLTYEVDGLRALMLTGGTSTHGVGLDFTVLAIASVAIIFLAGKLYGRIVI